MNRFYVDKRDFDGKRVKISGEDVKHITKVLRLGVGDKVVLCDGDNSDYDGEIQKIIKDEIFVTVNNSRPTGTEAPIDITLFQAVPKSTKMDFIIQKGTELGVKRFVPVTTARTVVRIESDKDEQRKIARWQRIALEAAKQSRRGIIPEVTGTVSFQTALDMMKECDLPILPYVGERSRSLRSISCADGLKTIAVFVGPEGGFEEKEVEQARNRGIITIKMGPRIFRTETAGMVLTAVLMYRFGDIGGL
ncbi:MAG: 16S rRNA (uracil(1498)-N(3))-methyltransferase [Firmicutes bacterium]|nr:16S rRNA (uracil(1498)-N(3))-methyltransferase [Bacillota bacterium]MDI6704788.1 16S rRNA (uracil(1498)-N(3))-methyltransferase [Bacillota bacterium]